MITNTTTEDDVRTLRERGLHVLITTTPRLAGRSFGTNAIEAVCRCLIDKPDDRITATDFTSIIEAIPLRPELLILNSGAIGGAS
jgi:hypothetical protein